MRTLWQEVSHSLNPDNTIGFTFSFGGGDEPKAWRRCLICNAKFEQTDEGWAKQKQHGFDEHEDVMRYDWTELHGKTVTIGVVQRQKTVGFGANERPGKEVQTELIARAEDGTVYFLPFSYYDDGDKGGFKCKPKSSAATSLLQLTQSDQASQSNG